MRPQHHNQPPEDATRGASGTPAGTSAEFVRTGMSTDVANELERRIEIIESSEVNDESRRPLAAGELFGYIAVAAAACLLGLLVVAL